MTLASVLPWFVAGLVLGAAYLFLIGRSVAAISDGRAWRAAGPLVLRLAIVTAALLVAARHGAFPPLLMLCGFVVMRTIALRRITEG